jgi:hypothetical protein
LNETANNGTISYTQNGAYLAGWQLLDSNKYPIAQSTVQELFGTPSIDPITGRPDGVNLTPANPSRPFAGFNEGWYFDAEPVNGAFATWADAFFGWGLGTDGYSPRNLSPSTPLTGALPNTSTPGVSGDNVGYTLSFQPAADNPPAVQVGVPVDLGSSYNRMGIVNDGTVFSSAGVGAGYALSGTLLGASVIANGTQFTLGSPGSNNVVSAAGQVISLPAGRFSNLNLLGLAVFGEQADLNFTVTYTDGTTKVFTQSMSDWGTSINTPNETTAAKMPYVDFKDGSTIPTPAKLSAYHFALDTDKSVESLTLPNDANAIFLAVTLT